MTATLTRRRVQVGQLAIDPLDFEEAVDAVCALVEAGEGGTVLTPNVDHVVLVEDDRALRDAYARASLSLADGMPVLWAARLLGRALPAKVSGSDLFVALMARAADRAMRVYFLGGGPGVAKEAENRLCARHPALRVVGTDAPFIDLDRDPPTHDAIVAAIVAARPDLVFVGFGCPKQEIVMERIARAVRPAVLVGVGASFDFVAGTVARAPRWMSAVGLEWAFRLAHEPRRLWRRYLVRDRHFVGIVLRAFASRRPTSSQEAP